jgi:SAM-dependent methyltransferase
MNAVPHHPELWQRHGDYGYDASVEGLMPLGIGGIVTASLASLHLRQERRWLGAVEAAVSIALLGTTAIYLHTTRRGKFAVWAELLEALPLHGDEQVLDAGCGRGAVLAMIAKLLPRGRATGLDLWTRDQSGNSPEATWRNLEREGVSDRCEIRTGDLLAMPFADAAFDLVLSSMAIHNIDERDLRHHQRRFQALDEVVRVLRPGGRLLIADFWSSAYAAHLRERGLERVERRPLGWRFWYGPWIGAGLATATKPAQPTVRSSQPRRVTTAASPGSSSTVVVSDSTIAGPDSRWLAASSAKSKTGTSSQPRR